MGDINQYKINDYDKKAEDFRIQKEAKNEKLTKIAEKIFDAINQVEVSGRDEDIRKLEILMNVKNLIDNYERDIVILRRNEPSKFERGDSLPEKDDLMIKITDALAMATADYHNTNRTDIEGLSIYLDIIHFLNYYERDLEVLSQSKER